MRTWTRTPIATVCGGCGYVLSKGDPLLLITVTYAAPDGRGQDFMRPVQRKRCAKCEGPAPPDLAPYVARTTEITPSALHRVGTLVPLEWKPTRARGPSAAPADWKMRAAEREPGEEG